MAENTMNIIGLIKKLNGLDKMFRKAERDYMLVRKELEFNQFEVEKLVLKSNKIINIDHKLLFGKVLLTGNLSLIKLAKQYQAKIDRQIKVFNDIDSGKYSDIEVARLIHKRTTVDLAIEEIGNEIYYEVFGNNYRYQLLEPDIVGVNNGLFNWGSV